MYEKVSPLELASKRGERPGVRAFMDVMLFLYRGRGLRNGGIYNRRPVRGGHSWSLHAVGRAADLMVPNKQLGDEIFLRLIRGASKLGIAEVIWNRSRWTFENGLKRYTGSNPHTDHLHVGFTRHMADQTDRDALTKWIARAVIDG